MAEGGEKRSPTAHRTKSQMRRHGREYGGRPEQKKNRAARNKARADMKKKYGAKALKGKDVAHVKPLSKGGSKAKSNLALQSVHKNRGHGMTRGKKPNKGR